MTVWYEWAVLLIVKEKSAYLPKGTGFSHIAVQIISVGCCRGFKDRRISIFLAILSCMK